MHDEKTGVFKAEKSIFWLYHEVTTCMHSLDFGKKSFRFVILYTAFTVIAICMNDIFNRIRYFSIK